MVDTREQNCTTPTDVIINRAVINGSAGGTAPCIRLNSNGNCETFALTVDWALIQSVANSPSFEARHTLCHEIGHTLGLRHYPFGFSPDEDRDSCMISGLWDGGEAWTKTYGPDHRAHVNGWFG